MSNASSAFNGFRSQSGGGTSLPPEFLTELLPAIDHLAELKVTLYALWLVQRQEAETPYFRSAELAADERLLSAFDRRGQSGEQALRDGLERAVQRGSLLRAVDPQAADDALYFLNDDRGRAALEQLESGSWHPDRGEPLPRLQADRPNIYLLYEGNIGPLTPLIAERLLQAQEEYPLEWIEAAFRIAVENNVRKWRYVEAILEDWKTKGRDEREDRGDPEATRQRYLGGEFGDYVKG